MKNILLTALMILGFSTLSSAQIKSATLTASGLTCSMCSKAIYKALQKLTPVEKVVADVQTSQYTITFKPGSAASPDMIKKAVEDAGFSVAELKFTAVFPPTQISNDAHVALGPINLHFLGVDAKTLQGEQTVTVLDKSFTTSKERARYAKFTSMKCYETGVMASCCTGGTSGRIYHVTL
jgi:copper chaperone CopZ